MATGAVAVRSGRGSDWASGYRLGQRSEVGPQPPQLTMRPPRPRALKKTKRNLQGHRLSSLLSLSPIPVPLLQAPARAVGTVLAHFHGCRRAGHHQHHHAWAHAPLAFNGHPNHAAMSLAPHHHTHSACSQTAHDSVAVPALPPFVPRPALPPFVPRPALPPCSCGRARRRRAPTRPSDPSRPPSTPS